MSCEQCDENREEGTVPDCETGKGCLIPPLSPEGARVMEMRRKLIALQGLVDSATVLRACRATMEEVELLAFLEENMKSMKPNKENG